MPTKPDVTLFRPLDTLYWLLFCGIPTGLAVGAMLTPQDTPAVAWIILWTVVASFWVIAALYFLKRWKFLKMMKFVSKHGITVAWEGQSMDSLNSGVFAVTPEEFDRVVDSFIELMRPRYYGVEKALEGCLVMMMPPTWIPSDPSFLARKVSGLQDGMLIYVGWRNNLESSALKHELGHRVLQVYAGDPDEATSHKMLADLGL